MGNIREWRERIRAQEENKLGAVYAACEKQGCSRDFVKAFITRAELWPMKQTLSFVEYKRHVEDWEILLRVLIEQNPISGKLDEWERCLKVLKNER
jgi:hypothetical protein